jgi:hypothetical protein
LPPIPTPPTTCRAPELVPVLAVAFDITKVVVVPVVLAATTPALENTTPFRVTDPDVLRAKVQVPDTNDEPVLTNIAVKDTLVHADVTVL